MNEHWLEFRVPGEWVRYDTPAGEGVDYLRGFVAGYISLHELAFAGKERVVWRICRRTSVNTFEVVHQVAATNPQPRSDSRDGG